MDNTSCRTSAPDRAASDGWIEPVPGEKVRIHVSAAQVGGTYSVTELLIGPRVGLPLHTHDSEDEHFVILAGPMRFVCGERTFDAETDTSITIPRRTPHTWVNLSHDRSARMLVIFTPGGFEQCFTAGIGAAPSEMEAVAKRFGCTVVGPPILGWPGAAAE